MIHFLYRGLNIFLITILGLILCAIQSVFLKIPALAWLELDCILLIVIYLSLHRNLIEGSLAVLILSRLLEVHSGAPAGVLTICYLMVFLGLLFTKEMFLVGNSFSSVLLSMVGGLIWKISFLILGLQLGYFSNVWKPALAFLIPYLLGLAVFSRIIFAIMKVFDSFTHPDPSAENRELSGEEF